MQANSLTYIRLILPWLDHFRFRGFLKHKNQPSPCFVSLNIMGARCRGENNLFTPIHDLIP